MRKLMIPLLGILLMQACKSPEARRPVTQSSGSYLRESIERNKKIVAAEEARIQEIMTQDSIHEYISSPHGFWYYYNTKDSTASQRPEFGDVVKFEYDLRSLDGKVIYSREELAGQTYTIDKEKLFSGLRQGLKLMKPGETVTFLFPSHKAFGYYGDKGRIGADVPVIATVTLNRIIKDEINNQNNQTENEKN